ncbi:DNA recombination protein RmuC [Pseudomonadales bacterium]|nr:DNA recombination protein RmuC [Pseudomonadales bacterium]
MSEWLNLAMYLFFSAAIGAAVSARLLHKKHRQALLSEVEAAETLAKAQGFQEGLHEGQSLKAQQLGEAEQHLAAANARLEVQTQQLDQQQQFLNSARTDLSQSQSDFAALSARMEEIKAGFQEKEKLFNETSNKLKQEFELLANKVFDAQGTRQQQSLQLMLNPFREQIGDFKKKVEEVYQSDTKERASLLNEVQNLQKASERINAEAENLTKALKGDNKLQGNWGELVLERVLEESGLRKDYEYFVQTSSRNAEGQIKRPDVVIRLPDGKDVVIDSKVNLVSYEQAVASEEDDEREQYLRAHLAALRSQIKGLSEQDYDQLPDIRSLDFVLLFIPIESAFTLAMEADRRLFTEAFNKRIMLVSPTTLMMALRIINNLWRVEKQNKNAQEIASKAGALYDKLNGVVEEVDKLGKQLATLQGTYDNVYARLASGRGNLVRQAEQFRELGARVKKPITPQLLQEMDDEDPADSERTH